MTKEVKLVAVNEIVGANLLANADATAISSLKSDAVSFINANAGIDIGDITISVVDNSSDTVHLALPYYSSLDGLNVEALKDSSLGEISGGEIFISICAFIGLGAAAVTVGLASTATIGIVAAGAATGAAITAGVATGTTYAVKKSKGK